MGSADLYLTKPGGISVSEALVKNLPMVFIDAVAGCEEYNRIHFIRSGVTVSKLTDVCLSLMRNDEKRKTMKTKLRKFKKRNLAQIIFRQ